MLSAKRELEALWTAVFHEPPAIDAEPALMIEMIIRCSPPPPVYEPACFDAKSGSGQLPRRPNPTGPDDTRRVGTGDGAAAGVQGA